MILLDLRCEYDLPRYIDLKEPENTTFNEQNFAWFQMPHDFSVPCSSRVESDLRHKILALGRKL